MDKGSRPLTCTFEFKICFSLCLIIPHRSCVFWRLVRGEQNHRRKKNRRLNICCPPPPPSHALLALHHYHHTYSPHFTTTTIIARNTHSRPTEAYFRRRANKIADGNVEFSVVRCSSILSSVVVLWAYEGICRVVTGCRGGYREMKRAPDGFCGRKAAHLVAVGNPCGVFPIQRF